MVYSVYSILIKSLLFMGLAYILWIVLIVPNDRRRARNTALLVFLTTFCFWGFQARQQHEIFNVELQNFERIANKKMLVVDKLKINKQSLDAELAELIRELDILAETKSTFYGAISNGELRNEQAANESTKLLDRINNLQDSVNSFRINLDSMIGQSTEQLKDSTKVVMNVILDRMQNYDARSLIRKEDYWRKLRNADESVKDAIASLIQDLNTLQMNLNDVERRISSTRRELFDNIRVVYVGSE